MRSNVHVFNTIPFHECQSPLPYVMHQCKEVWGSARRGRVAIGSLKFDRDPELIVYYSNILFLYICNAHLKLFRVSWSHTNGDPDIAALFLRQRRQKVVRPR